MSTCISREGEYSAHEVRTAGPAVERFICSRCGELAGTELLRALEAAEAEVARLLDDGECGRCSECQRGQSCTGIER